MKYEEAKLRSVLGPFAAYESDEEGIHIMSESPAYGGNAVLVAEQIEDECTAELLCHCYNKFGTLLEHCKAMLKQFDDLVGSGNMSAALDIGLNPMEAMKARKAIEDAEEVIA